MENTHSNLGQNCDNGINAKDYLEKLYVAAEPINCEREVTRSAIEFYMAYPLYKELKSYEQSADILTSITHPMNTLLQKCTEVNLRYYEKAQNILHDVKQEYIWKLFLPEYTDIIPYVKLFGEVYYLCGNMLPIPNYGNPSGKGGDTAIRKLSLLKQLFDRKMEVVGDNPGILSDGEYSLICELYNCVFSKEKFLSCIKTQQDVSELLKKRGSKYKIVWAEWIAKLNCDWETFVDGNLLNDFVDADYKIKNFLNFEKQDPGFNILLGGNEDRNTTIKQWLIINTKLILQRSIRIGESKMQGEIIDSKKFQTIFSILMEYLYIQTNLPIEERNYDMV